MAESFSASAAAPSSGAAGSTSSGALIASDLKSSQNMKESLASSSAATGVPARGGASATFSGDANGEPEDLNLFVRDLLEQMQARFSQMGDSILGRIDKMGDRIDDLERSVNDLMDQAGVVPPSGVSPDLTSTGMSGGGDGGSAVSGLEGAIDK
eukprot:CAMPEP_0183304354 /NCGR_PEP_ID=MMETSP0160_2-20130417/9468_1 /TAXON_ID=2839 ORGANISM="Odontella Sinensis, Strain Grunow 1884" /NCGR_SAMPLE_ID=MMETSP0160_2 /ASSEMBLY_ACC=CAM_ASM_000250 /LENGTH=153 /DNA_ID=CAMNT_0025467389 /DNA_START=31 /DNA_END=492 /DNA_ORIENTATION=-